MKNILTLGLILAAFAIGYFTGKSQNSPIADSAMASTQSSSASASPHNDKTSRSFSSSAAAVPTNSGSMDIVDSKPTSTAFEYHTPVDTSSDVGEAVDADLNVEREQLESVQSKFPLAQEELTEWQTQHKENLKPRMQEALGEAADFMFEQVTSNSPFLLDTTANTPLEDDLSWRYNAEQAITDFIRNHATDPSLEILQVVCIQKKCEITVRGAEQPAAFALYAQLTSKKPFNLKQASTPTIFNNDDGSFWLYVVLSFN